MGNYTKFITKEIQLRKDTPAQILSFINELINNKNYKVTPPEHPLFDLENWRELFYEYGYDHAIPPTFKQVKDKWILSLYCDSARRILDEIEQFTSWITPLVCGHKPKEYIGYYHCDWYGDRVNVYINRQFINNEKDQTFSRSQF